jgi:hypothetical protein
MSLTERVAELFKAKPGVWIDGRTLAQHGGAYAWRSRVSDCRKRGLAIENRQRKVDGYVVSEYKLVQE